MNEELRCDFRILVVRNGLIAIADLNKGRTSVTNDAEAVITWFFENIGLQNSDRFLYCDSEGSWDEMRHLDGRFVGFAPLRAARLAEAMKKAEIE